MGLWYYLRLPPSLEIPFRPHDRGTCPLANGPVYGGGEITEDNQMPVGECGNMLIRGSLLGLDLFLPEVAQ
ncbi:hypothetical protein OPIT5_20600 [Opitutaceae bacterium TAV5]|nr:hypothetical protein OPIT5_20600 [Opitutaceae bacterium TAV5]